MSEPRAPYAQASRELLRRTLLDAGRDLLGLRGWSEITMADVAAGGGVSRQTLYNEFGSREDFAQSLVLREVDELLTAVERALRAHADNPALALAAAFDAFLSAAAEDPLVRAIVSGDSADELLPLVTTHGAPVLELATDRLITLLAEVWPMVGPADAALLAECVVRLAITAVALPSGRVTMTGAQIATLLGPYLDVLQSPARVAVAHGADRA